jgi:DNA repair protein RadC
MLNLSTIHPQDVVQAALNHNAVAIIVVPNHPSRVVSKANTRVTFEAGARTLYVRLLNHIIVGKGETIASFVEAWFIVVNTK